MKLASPTSALLACWLLALASPGAQAAGFWPFKDSASKPKHTGTTLHGSVQQAVRPLGNHTQVKPIGGGTRKPPKTILAKRPP
jgi:hypothetical protein